MISAPLSVIMVVILATQARVSVAISPPFRNTMFHVPEPYGTVCPNMPQLSAIIANFVSVMESLATILAHVTLLVSAGALPVTVGTSSVIARIRTRIRPSRVKR